MYESYIFRHSDYASFFFTIFFQRFGQSKILKFIILKISLMKSILNLLFRYFFAISPLFTLQMKIKIDLLRH